MSKRFLTKSRFKVGYECPTKLYYLDNPTYGNNNTDNPFLEALAEGGFQVGELAKLYHPTGVEISTRDKDLATAETTALLKNENVIIYEAAFKFQNLFIKTDILIKKGPFIELVEVKAKSIDPTQENVFYNKNSLKKGPPKLSSSWEPYIVDIAFQTYVFKKSFPEFKVSSFLMLADKTSTASVDGINQKFFLEKGADGQVKVLTASGTRSEDLGSKLLVKIPVASEIEIVMGSKFENEKSFEEMVVYLSSICETQDFINPTVGSHCKSCEFRIEHKQKEPGFKSGFENCWSQTVGLKPEDFKKKFIFDIWNFRKSQKLIEEGKYFIDQIAQDDINPISKNDELGLSSSERQWLQVEKNQLNDRIPYLDHTGLLKEMNSWTYPLHFIDFETTMVAIPFHKGRRPYEQIAFQFSHHTVTKDGKISHQHEYINRKKGHFPNFDFVRSLMAALSSDSGTIFRYATHENTVLCQIRNQLLESNEQVDDRDQLIKFIEAITQSGDDS